MPIPAAPIAIVSHRIRKPARTLLSKGNSETSSQLKLAMPETAGSRETDQSDNFALPKQHSV
jgi:hypothetical protein